MTLGLHQDAEQNEKTPSFHFGAHVSQSSSASGVRRQEATNKYDVSFQILKDFWFTRVIVEMKHQVMLNIKHLKRIQAFSKLSRLCTNPVDNQLIILSLIQILI